MDIENSDLSMYQMEVPGLGGKLGLEVPAPVSEEVVISDSGVLSEPSAPGVPVPQETSQILEDQRVEEFMVELELDEDSRDSVLSQQQEPVYTMLEPAAEYTLANPLLPLSGSGGDDESVDSGLGTSESSSLLSTKKDSFSRLLSQGKKNVLIKFKTNK